MNELGKSIGELTAMSWYLELPLEISAYQNRFESKDFGKDGSSWLYQRFSCAIGVLGLQHFGIDHPFDIQRVMSDTVHYASKYFSEEQYHEERESNWLRIIQQPWCMALLLDDHKSVKTFCSWLNASREPEYAGPIDYAIVPLLNLYASIFGQVMSPQENSDQRILAAKSKSRVISSLIACFDSIEAGKSVEFEQNFAVGLKAFSKAVRIKMQKDDMLPIEDLFSIPHSIAWRSAELKGLRLPELPIELQAFFITRGSLGVM
jgi:hypothetical protein